MQPLELFSLILDVMLVVAAIVSFLLRPRIGGELSKGLRALMVGVMILGFAHLIETVLFAVFNFDLQLNEIVHRLLIVLGFIFVILGFFRMRQAFSK